MGTTRVEVSQQRTIPLLEWFARLLGIVAFRINEIRDDQLDCALRASIWVCRADWAIFRDGDHAGDEGGIVAVYGCGGGKDDVVDVVLVHEAKEGDCTADIDAVVFERNFA